MASSNRAHLHPCFFVPNGDVVISMRVSDSSEEISVTLDSDVLKQASPYFAKALSSEWVHSEDTDTEKGENGDVSIMKRFELELDSKGCGSLVAKTTPTDDRERLMATKQIHKLTQMSLKPQSGANDFPELDIASTVHLLGLCFICDFDSSAEHSILQRHERLLAQTTSMTCLVQKLIQWMEHYGTLERAYSSMIRFVKTRVPVQEVQAQALVYLRIACVFRNDDFFQWALNKNPLFGAVGCIPLSSLDIKLGLGPWSTAFERRLNSLGSELRSFQNLPERIPPFINKDTFDIEDWKKVLHNWNAFLYEQANKQRANHLDIDASVLALGSIAQSTDMGLPYFGYNTPSANVRARDYLEQARVIALQDVTLHILLDENEPLGFRLNNHDFFHKYGYPWYYRGTGEEDTDEALFALVATSDLLSFKEDIVERAVGCGSRNL